MDSIRVFNSGVQHGRSAIDVETQIISSRAFEEVWKEWGIRSDPAFLCAKVVAFVCRAGGPPTRQPLSIFLRVDRRLTRKPFHGDHYRGTVNVWVSPHKNPSIWSRFLHYTGKPLLPAYRVTSPKDALIACVAHEASHWLGIGRHPSRYWRDQQARDGTEFVCELMAATALEVFCHRSNTRFQEL